MGDYLVDAKGMTLYIFTRDTVGKSAATAAVLANWPIFYAATVTVPSSLTAGDFGSITRDDGSKQSTFKGMPLYYFVRDQAPGDWAGQGLNGVWWIINPAKFPPAILQIATPKNGDNITGSSVPVTIQVTNFNLADKQGQANVAGEGHVHYYLDVDAPTAPGKPAIPASGVWAHVASASNTFSSVAPGAHTISVLLVNNDHTPLIPITVIKVSVNVQAPAAAPTPTPAATGPAVALNLTAQGFQFQQRTLTAIAGSSVTLTFTNNDSGTPHNFALYTNSGGTPVFVGQTIAGVGNITYKFTAPANAGTYFFRCDVHPSMTGSFVVPAAGMSNDY